jgi:TolA-binding protein
MQQAEYVAQMQAQLDKLNGKMNSLEEEAQEAKDEARLKYKEEMGKLREQSKVAVAKLEELKTSGEDKWETMVTDMEKMHDAFTHSFFSFFKVPGSTASGDKSATAGQSDTQEKP